MKGRRRSAGLRTSVGATALALAVGLAPATAAAAPASWSLATTPVEPGGSTLWVATSCVRGAACMIVGSFAPTDGSEARAASATLRKSVWSIVLAPKQGAQSLAFSSVSCLSNRFCVAAGNRQRNGQYRPMAARWNGRRWSSMAFPSPKDAVQLLTGVSCWSTTGCVAVGWSPVGSWRVPITAHWNGVEWAIDAAANPTGLAELDAVDCPAPDDCHAVGRSLSASGYTTLVEHWNGASWAAVASPNIGAEYIDLDAVSCTGTSDCVATGWWSLSSGPPFHMQGPEHTLVEHWDGTSWSIVTSPDSASTNNDLTEVSCTAPSNCVAAGGAASDGFDSRQPLVEQWDGSQWTIVPVPSPGDTFDVPFGLSCGSASKCFLLGFSSNAGVIGNFAITRARR